MTHTESLAVCGMLVIACGLFGAVYWLDRRVHANYEKKKRRPRRR